MVKNGIGFGHIRRALLIAESIQRAGRFNPIVISQASSLALYGGTSVQVINFPLLHRVPSAITEDCYEDLLNRVLERLDPALVIEDTYPDARYRRLPALAGRPRLLIMRRLDGLSLDLIRQRGDLAHYDQILIAQDAAEFELEGHSGDTLAAVQSSGRFTLVGNLARVATEEEAAAARRSYASDCRPLIVVNGGAGGDQMPDGYGDRLFGACQEIAKALEAEGHPAKFVFVTGPYYAGRPLHETTNVAVRRFEPSLASLLAAADVAVIKPGNNALSETLAGQAHLILVPDVSFMEGLDEHAARTVARYGGAVGDTSRESLEPLIRDALVRPKRQVRQAPASTGLPGVLQSVGHHVCEADRLRVEPKRLLLLLRAPHHVTPSAFAAALPDRLRSATVIDAGEPAIGSGAVLSGLPAQGASAGALLVEGDVVTRAPQAVVDCGVRLLIQRGPAPAVDRWLAAMPPRPSLLRLTAEHMSARAGGAQAAERLITAALQRRSSGAVILDLTALGPDELAIYIESIGRWLAAQPVELSTVTQFVAQQAERLLEGAPR